MAAPKAKRVAFVISSIRQPRVSPQIAARLVPRVESLLPPGVELTAVDLSTIYGAANSTDRPRGYREHLTWSPDEPCIPAQQPDPPESYGVASSRAWSRLVASFDAFIFLTPQYNWNIPAALKNALDVLFKEWNGKPAGIVSYGGHGGDKANAALAVTLKGCRMKVAGKAVMLSLGKVADGVATSVKEGRVAEGLWEAWEPQMEDLREMIEEVVMALGGDASKVVEAKPVAGKVNEQERA